SSPPSSSACPTSAAKQTTSALYVSFSHLRMTDVSSPPEYASTTLSICSDPTCIYEFSGISTCPNRREGGSPAARARVCANRLGRRKQLDQLFQNRFLSSGVFDRNQNRVVPRDRSDQPVYSRPVDCQSGRLCQPDLGLDHNQV